METWNPVHDEYVKIMIYRHSFFKISYVLDLFYIIKWNKDDIIVWTLSNLTYQMNMYFVNK